MAAASITRAAAAWTGHSLALPALPSISHAAIDPATTTTAAATGTAQAKAKRGLFERVFSMVSPSDKALSNKMWGGRFAEAPDAIMEEINASIGFDQRLYRQDIAGSKAHATMLAATGILTQTDRDAILAGLDEVLAEIEGGQFNFSRALEDIHMNVESRLREKIGDAAGRLHTARSRNDQVATDFKLYIRDTIDTLVAQIRALQLSLANRAEEEAETIQPGFTNLQNAHPETFGHHLLAYRELLGRYARSLIDARKRLNENPLGSAALAGTPYPIDRQMTSEALGFDRPTANSLDAVSDRDFILETLAAAAICAMHLSRFAEEMVIWSS